MGKNELKYDNDLNSLRFRNFTQTDFDCLMAICQQLNGLGAKEVEINYETIMDAIEWDSTHKSIADFHEELYLMCNKLAGVQGHFKDSKHFMIFNLFETFKGNLDTRTLKTKVNPDFVYILNNLTRDFTKIELKEYVGLDSKYAKTLYMQIRQRYKLKGHFWQPTLDEIRTLLDVPQKKAPKYITNDIINPSVNIIRGCKGLAELEVEPIYARRRGKPLIGYRFTWTASDQIKGQSDLEQGLAEMTKFKRQKDQERKAKTKFNQIEVSPDSPKTKAEWDEFEKLILEN